MTWGRPSISKLTSTPRLRTQHPNHFLAPYVVTIIVPMNPDVCLMDYSMCVQVPRDVVVT